jgi:anti-sigma regulatory factor (Ser/Thr protein kinase)
MGRAHPRTVGVQHRAPTTIAPSTAGVEEPSLALPPHLSSIGHGRRWVAAQAAHQGVGATGLRIVQLLASELIANAVLHGPAGGAVTVRTRQGGDRIRVEVDDDDSSTRPRLLTRENADDGGHGLMLVDRFADRWGYDLHGVDGKTVWFEFVLPAPRA